MDAEAIDRRSLFAPLANAAVLSRTKLPPKCFAACGLRGWVIVHSSRRSGRTLTSSPQTLVVTTKNHVRRFFQPRFRALLGRAIMTSVDLTIAIASSPRRSFSARTASAVITAVSAWLPTRRRTCARSPSTRTSSINPQRRFRALNPPKDSSSAGTLARRRAAGCWRASSRSISESATR